MKDNIDVLKEPIPLGVDGISYSQKKILEDFMDKLLNSQPMPPEFSDIVDRHFWELI